MNNKQSALWKRSENQRKNRCCTLTGGSTQRRKRRCKLTGAPVHSEQAVATIGQAMSSVVEQPFDP